MGVDGIGVIEMANVLTVLEHVPEMAVTCKVPAVAALEKSMETLLVLPVIVAPVPV